MNTRAESLIILGIGAVVVVAIVRASSAAQEREARRAAAVEAYRAARAAELAQRPKFQHEWAFTGAASAVASSPGLHCELSISGMPKSRAALAAVAPPPGSKLSSEPIGASSTGRRTARPAAVA
jgi:hypothetical protein